jgi:hypothetical protein
MMDTPAPEFKCYFATVDNMNKEQRKFYESWLNAWRKGTPISVNGQVSYLFCYMYQVLNWKPQPAIAELRKLKEMYSYEKDVVRYYCDCWASDFYVVLKDYLNALNTFPEIIISSRSSASTDTLLSLKVKVGERIAGRDLMTLNGPKVTAWGKKHLFEIVKYLDVCVRAYENHENIDLLQCWVKDSYQYPYFIFTGSFKSKESKLKAYSFSNNVSAMEFVSCVTKEAENTVREEKGIPKIGEGWVAETNLYYELKNALQGTSIIHHARPKWLPRQHLDIFIPDKRVAVEYQGIQHDQPVDWFGGDQAFKATKRRDAKKLRLCKKNDVNLIYVRSNYKLKEVIRTIFETK